jgi:hypothetical protein
MTEYVPAFAQECDALVDDDQAEVSPTDQTKRYWMPCPKLLMEPPVLKVKL